MVVVVVLFFQRSIHFCSNKTACRFESSFKTRRKFTAACYRPVVSNSQPFFSFLFRMQILICRCQNGAGGNFVATTADFGTAKLSRIIVSAKEPLSSQNARSVAEHYKHVTAAANVCLILQRQIFIFFILHPHPKPPVTFSF